MITRPLVPELGDVSVVEVYEYFDEPVLFVCQNLRGQLFLASLIVDDETMRSWLYAPISATRFDEVREGRIELYTAFKRVEDGYLLRVDRRKIEASAFESQWLVADDVDDEHLPLPGDALDPQDRDRNEQRAAPDAAKLAAQSRREVISLRLYTSNNRHAPRAPVLTLGRTITTFQEVVDAVGQAELSTATSTRRSLMNKTRLDASAIFPGSFGLVLQASEGADLFGESDPQRALARVMHLLQSTGDDAELLAQLKLLGRRVANKYRDLLMQVAMATHSLVLTWGSPTTGAAQIVELRSDQARRALDRLRELDPMEPSEFEIEAELVALNVRTKTYEVWDVQGQRKITGRVTDDAMEPVKAAPFNRRYYVRIQERPEQLPTGEIDVKYRLLALRPSDDEGTS